MLILVDMYSKLGDMVSARKVFDEKGDRNVFFLEFNFFLAI